MSGQAEASADKVLQSSAIKPDAAEVAGTKELLEVLVRSAKSLASHPSIDHIIERFDRIQKLENDIRLKDGTIDQLHVELKQKIADHSATHEKSLATYDAAREKLKSQLRTSEDESAKLKQEIDGRDSALQNMTSDKTRLADNVKKLQGHLKSRGDEIKSLTSQVKQLEESARAEKSQNDKLGESLRDHETRLSRSQAELSELQKAHERLSKQERFVTGQLEAITSLFEELTDKVPDNSMRKLDELWEAACKFVSFTFHEDLPTTALQNKQAWEGLRRPIYWEHALPILQSKSIAAKQMRTVVVLTSLARTFDAQIFQPTYLLPHDSGVRDLLTRQALKDPRKEAAFRAVVQAFLPEEQEAMLSDRVNQTCEHLHRLVDALLPSERLSAFKKELNSITEDAAYIWQEILHSTYAVEACFNLETYNDWSWYHLEFEQTSTRITNNARQTQDRDRGLFAIFPRMIISDDDGRGPETHGVLFMKSQTAAAAEELECHNPSLELQRNDSVITKRHRPRQPSGSWPKRGDSVSFLDQGSGNGSPGGTRGD